MEQVLKNAYINILRNFLLIFSNFFLDIEKFYQALSTCQISDQLNYPNRNYEEGGGGGRICPSPGHTNLQKPSLFRVKTVVDNYQGCMVLTGLF